MRTFPTLRASAVAAAVLLGACADRVTAPAAGPRAPDAPSSAVRCTVSVRTGTLACAPGTGGGTLAARVPAGRRAATTPYPGARIIGGQGVNVQVASSNVAFDSLTRVLSADVTVQNLMPGSKLGSADGETPAGIRVFFHTAPNVTAGSGEVEVLPDGMDAFTGALQPYYAYPQALAPGALTTPRRWAFRLDPGVESFAFTVFVEAPVFRDGQVQPIAATWAQLDAAGGHTCGLVGTRAFCWGDGYFGKLGDGVTRPRFFVEPGPVNGGLQFREIAANVQNSCGVTLDHRAYCWGDNQSDQVGAPPTYVRDGFYRERYNPEPTPVSGGISFAQVTPGGGFTCGLDTQGKAYCWGINDYGQLGDGTRTQRSEPVPVLTSQRFTRIQSAGFATCALTESGQIWCWGDNSHSELGIETPGETCGTFATPCSLVPVRAESDEVFADLSKKANWACALNTAGRAFCWGNGAANGVSPGDESPPTSVPRPSPVQTPQPQVFARIFTGGLGSCGVRADGVAFCWGLQHRLFTDPATWRAPGDVRWRTLAMGGNRVCGVDVDGKGWCWGRESRGEIGNGAPQTGFFTSPVPIGPLHRDLPPWAGFDVLTGGREVTANALMQLDWFRDNPRVTHEDYDVLAFIWSWGDGTSTITRGGIASHPYAVNGTYEVVLTVIDDAGQRGMVSQNVTVYSSAP